MSRLSAVGNLVKGIAAVAALLPTVAVLRGMVPIPPDIDMLITWTIAVLGILVFVVVMLADGPIKAARNLTIAILAVVMALVGIASAVVYRDFSNRHIVTIGLEGTSEADAERIVVPHSPSQPLQDKITPFGNDWVAALHESPESDTIRRMIGEQNFWTTAWIVGLLVLAQVLTTGGLVLGLWKLATRFGVTD